jgi:hypothetical protein
VSAAPALRFNDLPVTEPTSARKQPFSGTNPILEGGGSLWPEKSGAAANRAVVCVLMQITAMEDGLKQIPKAFSEAERTGEAGRMKQPDPINGGRGGGVLAKWLRLGSFCAPSTLFCDAIGPRHPHDRKVNSSYQASGFRLLPVAPNQVT